MEHITHYDISELPNSSFNVVCASRRSGKTILVEQIIRDMRKQKKIDCCFLFSSTGSGMDFLDDNCKYTDIDKLHTIINNYKKMNEYNKMCKKNQICLLSRLLYV